MNNFVHITGMSENNSTHLTVDSFTDLDNHEIRIEPPLKVVFEGDQQVAITQDSFAARYDEEELRQIGGGNSILGVKRIIGDIAMNGNLVQGAIKPLHPTLIDDRVTQSTDLADPLSTRSRLHLAIDSFRR